jgi:acetyltransferase-like isoleucine patch superfamily enzyme
MLRQVFNKLLVLFGKKYIVNDAVSNKQLRQVLFKRFLMLFRGIVKIRGGVFLGKKVKINNLNNFSFGPNCTIEDYVVFDCFAQEKVSIGSGVKIGAYTMISITSHLEHIGKGLKIGSNSSVGEFSYFGCAGGVEIGDDVIMGQYISFHSQNHNYEDKTKKIRLQGVNSKGIFLGNNIWVGSKVTFLDGAFVGDNSVVAAGAVVSGHFPPNVVIGGVPAKILKQL